MSAFDCLRVNNKCGFRLANRFTQREVFKVFKTKDNEVRTDEFAAIPTLLPFKFLFKGMPNSIDIYKRIFLHVICSRIILL